MPDDDRPIYLDHHATTPLDERVLEAMLPFLRESFGNPASTGHEYGREAHRAVEAARQTIAECLGAAPSEVYFTSGATESNNLALKGLALGLTHQGRHIVSVATEHPAVLDPLRDLVAQGFEVTLLDVESSGLLDLEHLAAAIRPDTTVVSVMAANNEIGVLQPLERVAAIVKGRGAVLHSDAAQAVGKLPLAVHEMNLDAVSLTGHKTYGPKGQGALFLSRHIKSSVAPQMHGGGHERGLRSGTLNPATCVGLARALELAVASCATEAERLRRLRSRLLEGLRALDPGLRVNGTLAERLPGNLNVTFSDLESDVLMANAPEVALSTGSACASADERPSHVLAALGLGSDQIERSVRFGLGRATTAEDIERALVVLSQAATAIRHQAVAA